MIAPAAQRLPVGEHLSKAQASTHCSGHVRGDLAAVDETHERGSAQAKDLRGLLSGDLLLAREDADRLAPTQSQDDLLQHGVELLREFDPVVLLNVGQEVGSRRCRTVARLVRLDEAQHASQVRSVRGAGVSSSAGVALMRLAPSSDMAPSLGQLQELRNPGPDAMKYFAKAATRH